MSNLPEINDHKELVINPWSKLEVVKKVFAPKLTNEEFKLFVGLGMSLDANPFTREIWAVKYGGESANIFCGRDFYRRKAQEQPDYDGHIVNAIYENDGFSIVKGQPEHVVNSFKERGQLIGAFCAVYKKEIKVPFFVTVKLNEYNKGHANWKSMPETMIKKVAEAQALRGAYQGIFRGTYDESETFTKNTSYEDVTFEETKKELSILIGKCQDEELKQQFIDELTTLEASGELTIEKLNEIKDRLNGNS
jgi:phage recombination protein Bet